MLICLICFLKVQDSTFTLGITAFGNQEVMSDDLIQIGQEDLSRAMKTHLVWHEDEQAEVYTIDELDQLIDRLTTQAQQTEPFSVELSASAETSMLIVVGCEESHLEFFSAQSKPPIVGCIGTGSDDEFIAFSHRGHYSEIARRYCVPSADARAALRQYFLTGKRPDTIAWE